MRQPNLFYSVLALQRYGATLVQIEVVLNLLLVFYGAMKISRSNWPVVSEDVQERCLKRVSGRARFIEGLSPQQQMQATTDAVGDHMTQSNTGCSYPPANSRDTEPRNRGSLAGRRR